MLHQLSQFIRLHTAPSGAKECFVQLFLMCEIVCVSMWYYCGCHGHGGNLGFSQLGSCPVLKQLYVFQLDLGHNQGKHFSKDVGRSSSWSCRVNVGFASLHSGIKNSKRPLFLLTWPPLFCNFPSSSLFFSSMKAANYPTYKKLIKKCVATFTVHLKITVNLLYYETYKAKRAHFYEKYSNFHTFTKRILDE